MTVEIDAEENQAGWIRGGGRGAPAGERLVEAMATKLAGTEKTWIPYEGPQGGEGWQNVDTGDVEYTDEPPGEAITAEDVAEAALEAGVAPEELGEVVGDAAALGASGGTRSADGALDDAPMPLVDSRLARALRQGQADTYRDLAAARAGDDYSEEYYEELRSVLQNSLTDEEKRAVASEAGVEDVYGEVDTDDVEGDPERAQRALDAIDGADASALTDRAEQVMRDTLARDASRARHDETAVRMAEHVSEFRNADNAGSGRLTKGRASFRTAAGISGSARPNTSMRLSGDTSGRTVTHEFAHALADAFAFDTVTGNSISHNYPNDGLPDWDFGPSDPSKDSRSGFVDRLDDGHEHGRKRQYMLTKFPDWEDREPKAWGEWAGRGEPVEEADTRIGDRLALRAQPHKSVPRNVVRADVEDHLRRRDPDELRAIADDLGVDTAVRGTSQGQLAEALGRALDGAQANELYDRINGAAIEGSVVPETNPVKSADDLRPGDTIEANSADVVDGPSWGFINEDIGEVEVDEVVAAGDYIVIAEDATYPLPAGADPDEYERRPEVHDVIEAVADGALVADDDGEHNLVKTRAIDKLNGQTNKVLRDASGDEHPLDVGGEMVRMAGVESRDWVDSRGRNPAETWRGETVRVAFGASDDRTGGVVVDETNSQCTIAYHDGNGNYKEKTVNKSNAYNQQLEFAQDKEEFQVNAVDPDREPPGLREAQYDTMDLNEAAIDWDTSVQYDDPQERVDRLSVGDVALIKDPGGDRHVVKVTDAFEPTFAVDGPALELQGDAPGGRSTYDITGGDDRMIIGEGDYSLMGVSPKEDWVEDTEADAASGSVGIRTESLDVTGLQDLLDLSPPPDASPHDDFRVGMKHPETGEVEQFVGRVDRRNDLISLREVDGLNKYAVQMDSDERPPPVITWGPEDEREAVGSITDVVSADTGETVEGGFEPESASELEEGMVAEVQLPPARGGSPRDRARDGYDYFDDRRPINLHEAAADATFSDPDSEEATEIYNRLKETNNYTGPALQDAVEAAGYEGRQVRQRAQILEDAIQDFPDYEGTTVVTEVTGVDPDNGRFTGETGAVHRVERVRRAADTSSGSEGGGGGPASAEEAVENLMSEVNKAWHRMVTAHENDGEPNIRLHIGSGYSETNAHETLAKTHEAMQSQDGSYAALDVAKRHPGLFEAYTELFDISEANKETINDEYEKDPYAFRFDDTPFPEVGPVEVDPEEAFPAGTTIEVGDYFDTDTVEVRSVVEGDLLVEGEDGEERWLNPAEAAYMLGLAEPDDGVKIV